MGGDVKLRELAKAVVSAAEVYEADPVNALDRSESWSSSWRKLDDLLRNLGCALGAHENAPPAGQDVIAIDNVTDKSGASDDE